MQWEFLKWEPAEEYSYKSNIFFGNSKRDCQFYYAIANDKRVVKKEYDTEIVVFNRELPEKLSFNSMEEEFKKEFCIMKDIEESTRNNSKPYPFPHYYAHNIGNHPCIVMENIELPYESLEQRLQKSIRWNPSDTRAFRFQNECVFGSENLLKIIKQLNSIIRLLFEHGILYIDLQPENILIDDEFNLKLVDFTWCFNIESYRKLHDNYHRYKIPENRISFQKAKDPAILIYRAFGHLIARLHYHSACDYNDYFDDDKDNFMYAYPGIFGDLIPQEGYDPILQVLKNTKQTNSPYSELILYERAYQKLVNQLKKRQG